MKHKLDNLWVVAAALFVIFVGAVPVKAQAPRIRPEPLKRLSMTLDALDDVIDRARGYKCPDLNPEQARRIAMAAGELEDILRHYPGLLKEMRVPAHDQVEGALARLRSTRKSFGILVSDYFGPQQYRLYPVPPRYPTPEQGIKHLEIDLPERVTALAAAARGFRASRPIEPRLYLEKKSVKPGENMLVRFWAPACLSKIAWVGIVPSGTRHGSEDVNDQRKVGSRRTLGQLKEGTLTFEAPAKPGLYDLRMNNGETTWPHGAGLGKELVSFTFSVTSKEESESPKHPFHGRWRSSEGQEFAIEVNGNNVMFGFATESAWDNHSKTTGKIQGVVIHTTWEQVCTFNDMKKWVHNKGVPARLTLSADGKSLVFETRVIECKQDRLLVTNSWEKSYGGKFLKISNKVPARS